MRNLTNYLPKKTIVNEKYLNLSLFFGTMLFLFYKGDSTSIRSDIKMLLLPFVVLQWNSPNFTSFTGRH